VDAEENQRQVFHRAHSPWKSLRDSHISTASAGRGKMENQKQVSHFPTCCFCSQNPIQKGGLAAVAPLPPSGSFFNEKMLNSLVKNSLVSCKMSLNGESVSHTR